MVIIRGIPGTGKSTLARKYVALGYKHYEADMFFEQTGEYKFDPARIGDAHAWCRANVRSAMKRGRDVVVSNTFTRKWEYEDYIKLAQLFDYVVDIITLTKEYGSIHDVPAATVDKMRARFEI